MKDAKDLIPWKVTDISIRPYEEFWSMNPSIHFDGSTWRCVLRCVDYAMPGGVTIRSSKARPSAQQTKNAMVIFDPKAWKPIKIYKMHENDQLPRVPCGNLGYEDMRLFKTDRGGFQGIAASLHLQRKRPHGDGGVQHQPPEQVVLSFDSEYNIIAAKPIRGDGWSGTPQKNWVPFDHCVEPRFLYSIGKGTMFDDRGAVHGDSAQARPSVSARPVQPNVSIARVDQRDQLVVEHGQEPMAREDRSHRKKEEKKEEKKPRDPRTQMKRPMMVRGTTEMQVVRGKRSSHTPAHAPMSAPKLVARSGGESRVMNTGRAMLPRYEGLRGGTQLERISQDSWLGIGHEMKWVQSKKYYWHTWYLVDSKGRMMAASEPMKLAANGIEFAAGMGIDGDRVVVSFGVDDMECKIGETQLSAVLKMLRAVDL